MEINKYKIALNAIKEAFEYLRFPQIIETSLFKNIEKLVDSYDDISRILKSVKIENEKDFDVVKKYLEE